MKIRYNGTSPVDIVGHSFVETGQVVDVPDDLAAALLLAGSAIDDNGTVTPPAKPLWTRADKKADKAEPTIEPADAGKES